MSRKKEKSNVKIVKEKGDLYLLIPFTKKQQMETIKTFQRNLK